jgi:hypothetical protein
LEYFLVFDTSAANSCSLIPNFRPQNLYMKFRLLLLALLLSLSSFNTSHKFYVSVTEIEYNEEQKSLQIISRVFIDDLEDMLKKRYDRSLKLSKSSESKDVRAYLEKYLSQKFSIEVNGKKVDVKYLGKEYDNDMAILYLEATNVQDLKSVKVKNAVLTDMFDEQKNLVHVEYRGTTKSLILTKSMDQNMLNFKD